MARQRQFPAPRRLAVASLALAVAVPLVACQPVAPNSTRPPAPSRPATRPAVAPVAGLPAAPPAPSWSKYVGTPRVLSTNAGWCWWQSRRAVLAGNQLVVGSVPNKRAANGATRLTQALSMDLGTKVARTTNLAQNPYRDDDHDSPGLAVGTDGSVTAGFTGHGEDDTLRVRRSTAVGQGTWTSRPNVVAPPQNGANRITYSNMVWSEGLLWNFSRRDNRTWVSRSSDKGVTWQGTWLLFEGHFSSGDNAAQRPYVMFTANPAKGRIDFVTTSGHPKDIRSAALYSGYLKDMKVYRTDGTLLGNLGDGPGYRPVDLTLVASPADFGGDPSVAYSDADLWGSDLTTDSSGDPVVTYSLREPRPSLVKGKTFSHWYYWAHWDEGAWVVSRVAAAGGELFGSELDYTGLISVDPADPYRAVISTDVDPVTAQPLISTSDGLAHFQIFEGRSTDHGGTWSWRPITRNGTEDNIRPLLAADGTGRWALVWLRGVYSNFWSWDMRAIVLSGTTTP